MASIQSKIVQLLQDSPAVQKAAKEVYGSTERAAEYLMDRFAGKKDVGLKDVAEEIADQKKFMEVAPEELKSFEAFTRKEGLPTEKSGLPAVIDKKRGKTSEAITPEVIEAPTGKEQLRLPPERKRDVIELGGKVDDGIEPQAKIVSDSLKDRIEKSTAPSKEASSPVSFLDRLKQNKKDAAAAIGLTGVAGLAGISRKGEDAETTDKEAYKPKSPRLFDEESISMEEAKREKAQKNREKLTSDIGEFVGGAYDSLTSGFAPSRERTENLIKYLRKSGGKENLRRADALEARLQKEEPSDFSESTPLDYRRKEAPVAPVGLGPTPDRMYNALEPEAKPTSLLEATQKAQQKTKAPKPAATTEGASLSLTGEEEKAPPAKEPTIQETLKERLAGLDARRQEAKAEREQKRKEADWGELASIIGRSLAQIGAAQQGLRTGVDMSKAVGPALIDWEKKKDRIDADYAQNIKELESERREATRLAERAEDQEIRDRYRKEDYEKQKELENLKYNNKLRKDNAKGILSEAKAMMKGDIASFKNNITAEKGKLKDYEDELAKLNQLKGSIAANEKSNKIIEKATPLLGDLVDKDKFLWFDIRKSNEEIDALANQRIEALTTAINQAKDSIKRQQEQVVRLKSTTPEQYAQGREPAAPSTPQAPQAPVKALSSEQLSQVAKRDGLSEAEARKKLEKLGYTIRD